MDILSYEFSVNEICTAIGLHPIAVELVTESLEKGSINILAEYHPIFSLKANSKNWVIESEKIVIRPDLAKYPLEVIDYYLCHEVAHALQANIDPLAILDAYKYNDNVELHNSVFHSIKRDICNFMSVTLLTLEEGVL
jgi:hypothetical protein